MSYETHDLVQGSPEWHAHRARCHNASDTGTALNVNPYKSRQELVRELASGVKEEIDAATQRRFDDGHRFERLARPLMEAIIGEQLFTPTISMEVPGLSRRLSASLDGTTIDDTTNAEHKTLSEALAAAMDRGELPEQYPPQMEHGMLINGATRYLFMASKWDENDQLIDEKHAWYESNPVLRAKIIPALKQLEEDVANYQHVEVLPPAVAAPTMQLPALSIRVEGSIALVDNLDVFGQGLRAFIAKIPEKPATDQEFADCKEACKKLQDAQDRLDAAESAALAQVASFDEMRRTKALLFDLARTTRLTVEKLVVAREKTIKAEIVQGGKDALAEHINGLSKRLGKPYMPAIDHDFAGAAKNKRTIASLRDAVDTELARAKIEANEIADRIQINLATLQELARGYDYLFADAGNMITKDNDDFAALVKTRIADHVAAEAKRLDAEREKIRAEEQEKLIREREEQLAREQRERVAALAQEKAAAQGDAISQAKGSRSLEREDPGLAPAAPHSSAPVSPDPREPLPSPAGTGGAGTYIRPEFDAPPWGKLDTRRDDGSPAPALDDILAWMARAFGVTEATAYRWLLDIFRERLAA